MELSVAPGGKDGPKQILKLDGQEIETVKAVFIEDNNHLIAAGNIGSVSTYDRWIALWKDREVQSLVILSYVDFAQKLEDFADRTEEEVQRIALESDFPAYANDTTIQRMELGSRAMELAVQLRESGDKHFTTVAEPEIPDAESPEFEAGLKGLLDGGDSQLQIDEA